MTDHMITGEAVRTLCGILDAGVDVHRCAAAQALAHVPGAAAGRALKNALLDEDADVRADAAAALGARAVRADAGQLMENLVGDPNGDVKKAALSALIALRHPPIIELLRKLAVERTDALVWDDDAFFAEGWDDWLDLQVQAVRGIARMGDEDGVAAIVAAINDEQGQDISEVAVAALMELGVSGGKALEELLAGGDSRMHRRIAKALKGHDCGQHAALLDACLRDPEGDVRLAAVEALAGYSPGDQRLQALLADPDARVRIAVLTACGRSHPAWVLSALHDGSAEVQAAAFAVISESPDAFAGTDLSEPLREAFDDSTDVALAASLAWAAMAPEAALPMLGGGLNEPDFPVEFRVGVIEPLRRVGPAATRYLAVAAVSGERPVRLAALTLLADFAAEDSAWPNPAGTILMRALAGDLLAPPEETEEQGGAASDAPPEAEPAPGSAAVEPVVATAPDEGAAERHEISAYPDPDSSTLGAILAPPPDLHMPDDVPDMELSDEDGYFRDLAQRRARGKKRMPLDPGLPAHVEIRRYGAALLANISQREVCEALIAVLGDADEELPHAALAALAHQAGLIGTLPDTDLETLMAFLEAKDADIRILAIRAIGSVAGPRVDERLDAALSDPASLVRLEAVRAWDRRDLSGARMQAQLSDSWPSVRLAAATALARHRGADALAPLIDFAFAEEGMHGREAGRLLGRVAPVDATRAFLDVLGEESRKREWLVAINALEEIFAAAPAPEPDLKVA